MEEYNIESIYRNYNRRLDAVSMEIKRYLYDKINWSNRLIGIKGSRGVGKTTLILQHIKEAFPNRDKALYVSLDNLWFENHSLIELVEYHYTHGGTHLFLDEIHRYPHWQILLKNIIDDYPDLNVVYTGSSMLEIDSSEGDLSRRQVVYKLCGLSFREFLAFEGVCQDEKPVPLDELLENHVSIASRIASEIKVLPYFERYLKYGYYPFYKEEGDGFEQRLQATVRQVLEADLPSSENVSYATVQKTRRMLMILAEKVPHTPKMLELYQELETNREQGLKMLSALERGGLLSLLTHEVRNYRSLSRPDKFYLDNPNLMYALSTFVEIGTVRETFFNNQLSVIGEVLLPLQGDFLVDRKYLFEVGGRGKTFDQIKDIPLSYLAVDATEVGHHNRIPLWVFGLLY